MNKYLNQMKLNCSYQIRTEEKKRGKIKLSGEKK